MNIKNKYKILIVDDNRQFISSVKAVLQNMEVISAYSPSEAKQKINNDIDLILLDLVFDESNPKEMQGLDILQYIKKYNKELPVVIMTNYASVDKSVKAIKMGAKDFIQKGKLDWSEWENRILNYCSDYRKIKTLEEESQLIKKNQIIGTSDEIVYVKRKLKDLAVHSSESSILLNGETGTGKNLAVQYFKSHSKRKNNPYQEFSISEKSETVLESELFGHTKGAFTGADFEKKGLFESADKGILFLDEIGDYSLSIQSKILKFLEDKKITPVGSTESKFLDIQLIMATNKDLKKLIRERLFREDLYYRIDRININIAPLRERKKDIRVLTDYFFDYYKYKENTNLISISEEVYPILEEYSWPGNVRELQSVLLKACSDARLYGDKKLKEKHITKNLDRNKEHTSEITFSNYQEKMAKIELEAIDKALEKTFGQKTKAAELLGMTADQMRYRIINNQNKNFINNFKNIKNYYLKNKD